jgi:hypothetical protein
MKMWTNKGESIARDLYDGFRDRYLARHHGANENDVERAFLCDLSIMVYGDLYSDTMNRIDQIR